MIFRVYTLCWLTFACADEINRIQSAEEDDGAVAFGHYELEEIESEPDDMPAQSEDATLKDVKFISKISATESLLITEKNVTWKYDEEANTLKKISFDGNKTPYESDLFTQMGDIEYGFSQHLLRMYVNNKTEARLVVVPSMSLGEHHAVVELDSSLYDDTKPPRILYLDAEETENRKVPSVLMFTQEKETGKGTYVLNSDAMTCGGTSPFPVKLNISREFNLSDTNVGVGGIASDGASFWVLTAKDFVLYVFHSCKQVEEEKGQGETVEKPVYDYKGILISKKLNVSYRGESASELPLGVWIDVSKKDRPVIEGKIIAISEDGKLLSADAPSAP